MFKQCLITFYSIENTEIELKTPYVAFGMAFAILGAIPQRYGCTDSGEP